MPATNANDAAPLKDMLSKMRLESNKSYRLALLSLVIAILSIVVSVLSLFFKF